MNERRTTLIWVILFAGVVIVPTICLLWFMEQAVQSERLSVQKQRRELYEKELQLTDWNPLSQLFIPDSLIDSGTVHDFVSHIRTLPVSGVQVIRNDSVLYPFLKGISHESFSRDSLWDLEFKLKQYDVAARNYLHLYNGCTTTVDSIEMLMGAARCHKKSGDNSSAIELYDSLLTHFALSDSTEVLANATVALARLYSENSAISDSALIALFDPNYSISKERRLFLLRSLERILKKRECCDSVLSEIETAIQFETSSSTIDTAEMKTTGEIVFGDSISYYAVQNENKRIVMTFTRFEIESLLESVKEKSSVSGIVIQMSDRNGVLAGKDLPEQQPVSVMHFQEGTENEFALRFYIDESVAGAGGIEDQRGVMIWMGALAILFIVITSSAAGIYFVHQTNLNQLKNTFLATVTHELKTPIASCRILIDTLMSGKVSEKEKVQEYYQFIAQENLRLSRLVDNFLTFSRMERKKQLFDRSLCSLSEITSAAIESMAVKFNRPDCNFSFENRVGDIELSVNGDAIITVITNLLDNAWKYSGERKEILLVAAVQNGNLVMAVKDNGIGISKRDQQKIFQKFYQVDRKLNRSAEGCGLGLSIVLYIVHAHGGTVTVESQEQVGSTFTVTLPIQER